MKRYVFITPSIRNIGGAELYVSRKLEWLKSQGWVVDIYYYNVGEIKIQNLKAYANNCIKELSIPYPLVNHKIITDIVRKIKNKKEYNLIIIESHTIQLSLIAENISKKLGAYHLLYWLSENYSKSDLRYIEFFRQKLMQNSLYSIGNKTLPMFLGQSHLTMNRGLTAVGSAGDNVADIEFSVDAPNTDFRVLSLGRLDKPYVNNMVEGVIKFMNSHPDKTLCLYFVGGAADESTQRVLKNKLNKNSNIFSFFLGYMHPVPRKLFKIVDVAIASAGSAWLPYYEDVLTITVDANDLQPLGILGYTTKNVLYRDDEKVLSIEEYLCDILVRKNKIQKNYSLNKENVVSANPDYSCHLKAISEVVHNYVYSKIDCKRSVIECLVYIIVYVLGSAYYFHMKKLYDVIRGKCRIKNNR